MLVPLEPQNTWYTFCKYQIGIAWPAIIVYLIAINLLQWDGVPVSRFLQQSLPCLAVGVIVILNALPPLLYTERWLREVQKGPPQSWHLGFWQAKGIAVGHVLFGILVWLMGFGRWWDWL
jgi:hypothetical protein